MFFFETKTDETPEPGSRGGHSYFENARILGDLHDLQETHLEEKSHPLPQFAYSSKISTMSSQDVIPQGLWFGWVIDLEGRNSK